MLHTKVNEKPSQEAGFGEEQDNRGKGHMRREGQWPSPSSAGEQRLTEESWGIIIARHIHVAETKKKNKVGDTFHLFMVVSYFQYKICTGHY